MSEAPESPIGRRLPVIPTLIVAAAVAAMIALGVWQLRRAEWKAELLARYERAQAMSSNVPWPRTEAERERSLFRWSQFDCTRVIEIRSRSGTSITGEKGWAHIADCVVNPGEWGRGEVALGWSRDVNFYVEEPYTRGELRSKPIPWSGGEVSGIIGPGGILYAAQAPAGLKPLAPPDPNDLPNNHLMYAGQWFFFALTALVIYVLALRKRWRSDALK